MFTDKKVAVVTGASKGFGRAVAAVLVRAGWSVIGDARDQDELTRTKDELAKEGDFIAVPGSVTNEDHLHALVNLASEVGKLSLLVNNAGTLGPTPRPSLQDLTAEGLEGLFETNVISPLRLIQLALPRMSGGGVVINVTSDASITAYAGWGGYSASKAALDSLTGVLDAEDSNEIRFYALDPGDLQTDMHREAYPGEDISDRRLPEESAPAIIHLLSELPPSGRYRAEDLTAE